MHSFALYPSQYGPAYELPSLDSPQFDFHREMGNYEFRHFTERSNPELALAAQQVQGESYLDAGYVTSEDLDEYGRLVELLDQARGDHVQYVVAEANDTVAGAVRFVTVPYGGDLLDLPSYKKSVHDMDPVYSQMLQEAFEENSSRGVVEIAGLSRRKDTPPSVLLEMIREIVQQAVRSRSDELWLVTATDNSFEMIRSRFGQRAITPIGARVPVLDDGTAVNVLGLQPSIIDPNRLIENIAISAHEEMNGAQKRRLLRTLGFMIDGLDAGSGEVPLNALTALGQVEKV